MAWMRNHSAIARRRRSKQTARAAQISFLGGEPLPTDSASVSVAVKVQESRFLVTVQPLNRGMKAALGINFLGRRQRIVDMGWPGFILKSRKNDFLVFCGHTKSFDENPSHAK